jgi:hypothetical protein
MASFSDLATELVEHIFSYLSQPDFYALSRISKGISPLALSYLYRHVDLFIPTSNKLPRIDRFCLNIITDPRKAARVDSMRLGLCPGEGFKEGQRWVPLDKSFNDKLLWTKAVEGLRKEGLMATGDYLRDAIGTSQSQRICALLFLCSLSSTHWSRLLQHQNTAMNLTPADATHYLGMREYSSYAALILLFLPSLQRLDIADYKSATFDHLHTILRNLDSAATLNRRHSSQALRDRLSSIKHLSLTVDRHSGVAYPSDNSHYTIDHFLHIPCTTTLELSVPAAQEHRAPLGRIHHPLVGNIRPTNITTLVFRHSGPYLGVQFSLLESTPQLRSFTYDMFWDCSVREVDAQEHLFDLAVWTDALRQVSNTLEILVFGAEYCDTSAFFFNQPRIGQRLYGYLDLTSFERLHTLEAPFPFLTGDPEFSITTEIYPLLPPNLRHLSLRPDLSHAQSPFPFDISILPQALTFTESKHEAQYLMNARMDVSYMFQASLTILEQVPDLDSITVHQPRDSRLEWFDGQVEDFATTCRNKGVTGKILESLLLKWKKAKHWDGVREITVFDRCNPGYGVYKRFFREEWENKPLGLASQYHLHALRTHQVKLHR